MKAAIRSATSWSRPLDAFHVKQSPYEPELRRYEDMLAGPGIDRGLLGPRERDRLWQRHILNCAVVAADTRLIPRGAAVVDVGTGAGLPGIVWALVRPDITMVLVESLLRRTTFLEEAVAELGLTQRVIVRRSRAEDLRGVSADVVTARAVAPLPRLLGWLRPLAKPDGQLVLLKGRTAAVEMAEAAAVAQRLGLGAGETLTVGMGEVDPPTTVVRYRMSGHGV